MGQQTVSERAARTEQFWADQSVERLENERAVPTDALKVREWVDRLVGETAATWVDAKVD